MTESAINRPEVSFDAVEHAYRLEGEDVLGVSSIAKVGAVDDAFNIASAWGFRLGYEGAWDVAQEGPLPASKDGLREELKARGLTPWSTRDKAAKRGSWVHDGLEELGQDGAVPDMVAFAEKHGAEAAGHMQSVLAWFLYFRPKFVAMEVQVASREHRFAGRYDVRCIIDAERLLTCVDPLRDDPQAVRIRELAAERKPALCLVDLKTSKGIYATTHFPQLEGYEGAGVEMGYPATDARCVLNTWPTGEHDPSRDFAVSWATYEDFLAFAPALRAIKRLKAADPERMRKKLREQAILSHLPARSRELADLALPELAGMTARELGFALGGLRKRGKVRQDERKVWHPVETET